jgi:acetylornithine deacetylase/succinyl-diaminopimelate desuccinylase-like protein
MPHIIDEKFIIDIFRISSPTNKEDEMRKFIKNFLSLKGVDFTEDKIGNIYNLTNKNVPLLSAHMDTVEKLTDSALIKYVDIRNYKGKKFLKGYGVIGGDDKCGIYLILKILEEKIPINFVFSVQEECGAKGIQEVIRLPEIFNSSYGIVLDRKNNSDIICKENNYGVDEFDKEVSNIGNKFGFKSIKGGFSDSNYIRNKISCVNLSCGYHEPHTVNEYVSLEDLSKTFDFVKEIISTINKNYEAPKIKETYYNNKNYNNNVCYYNNPRYCSFCYKVSKEDVAKVGDKTICKECASKILKGLFSRESLSVIGFKDLAKEAFDEYNKNKDLPLLPVPLTSEGKYGYNYKDNYYYDY